MLHILTTVLLILIHYRLCKEVDISKSHEPSFEDNDEEFNPHATQSGPTEDRFLFVHQEKWQGEQMKKYGRISLMDASYKTTKYTIPLFFVCVKTNMGYSVVGE